MKILLHLGQRIEEFRINEKVAPPELVFTVRDQGLPVRQVFYFAHRADGFPLYAPSQKNFGLRV
jgi:hypothetical protein